RRGAGGQTKSVAIAAHHQVRDVTGRNVEFIAAIPPRDNGVVGWIVVGRWIQIGPRFHADGIARVKQTEVDEGSRRAIEANATAQSRRRGGLPERDTARVGAAAG